MSKTKTAAVRRSSEEAAPPAIAQDADVPWRMIFVMARIFYAMRSRCEDALKPFGLTSMQFTILSTLRRCAGLSSAELSRRFNVTPQTMGEMIVNLERRSLVARQQDPQNRRALKLNLTDEGYKLLAEGEQAMVSVEEDMFAGVSASDRDQLRERLVALHDQLNPPAED